MSHAQRFIKADKAVKIKSLLKQLFVDRKDKHIDVFRKRSYV